MLIWLAYAALWLALLAYVAQARRGTHWAGRLAIVLVAAAWLLLTAGLVKRGLAAGHWPLTNRYEVALLWTWVIAGLYPLLEAGWRVHGAGAWVVASALLVASYALRSPASEQAVAPLLPALRSPWLQVHVVTSAVGYGAFAVAAGLALMRLWRRPATSRVQQPAAAGSGTGSAPSQAQVLGLSRQRSQETAPLPAVAANPRPLSDREIERAMERAVGLGFPWLTLGILSGAIWAQNVWGRYWGWDPKETWALVTWLWYLLVLHIHRLHGWAGRRLAWLVLIGFGIVFFTFTGVPWLVRTVRLESLHGF